MIFLRPLLVVMNIAQIRILLSIILIILAIILLIQIAKKINISTAIIFLLGMFISDYFYMGLSLQGAPVFLICMITAICVINEKSNKNADIIFLIVGGLTSFFDFLTVPIITLTIPLLIYILLRQKEESLKYKSFYIEIIKLIVLWGIGYGGTFVAKWFIVDCIYNKDVISSAFHQLIYRSNSVGSIKYTLIDVLDSVFLIIKYPLDFSILTVIIMILYKVIKYKTLLKYDTKRVIPYILILTIVIMWYLILANHSYLHSIFTYRNSFTISICIMLSIYNILSAKKE